jgi:surface protein
MFIKCECTNIPDISKWNISNLTNIMGMFSNCIYLTSLPDISNWDISNLKDISKIFDECKSLKSLPDIYQNGILQI